jgi:hypothetical protein
MTDPRTALRAPAPHRIPLIPGYTRARWQRIWNANSAAREQFSAAQGANVDRWIMLASGVVVPQGQARWAEAFPPASAAKRLAQPSATQTVNSSSITFIDTTQLRHVCHAVIHSVAAGLGVNISPRRARLTPIGPTTTAMGNPTCCGPRCTRGSCRGVGGAGDSAAPAAGGSVADQGQAARMASASVVTGLASKRARSSLSVSRSPAAMEASRPFPRRP